MKEKLKFFLAIILGNVLLAFAVCAFVVPNGIMLGGSNGIALFLQQFIPLRLSVISAVVNVALFLLGLAFLGWKFAASSLLSTIIYPLILGLFESLPLNDLFSENIVISALACGVLCGLGIGMVSRVGGSTGGMDIPPCILQKYKGIPVGNSVMFFDILVVLMQVVVKGMDGLLLSVLVIVIMSVTINKTVLSGDKKIQIMIISPQFQVIRQEILENIDCGVTMLEMEGGYEGEKRQAILTVVYSNKYTAIRDAALKYDKHAFIVASDVTNVNGIGYTISR
jgi:uncharacterized membrane-anchored protein YitT (DUF2179 family)